MTSTEQLFKELHDIFKILNEAKERGIIHEGLVNELGDSIVYSEINYKAGIKYD